MIDSSSPAGLEVFQLTEGQARCSHVYMEARIFTPDSKRLLLHGGGTAHPGSRDRDLPQRRFLLCDLENDGELIPLIQEPRAVAPSVSPDGTAVYYFLDHTEIDGGHLTLVRVGLDGSNRETLLTIDRPLPGSSYRIGRLYGLTTISADGRRLAATVFLGGGEVENAPWGILVIDLKTLAADIVHQGSEIFNAHLQYSRSTDPQSVRDLLFQENHGGQMDVTGMRTTGCACGPLGMDLHVIRDDGSRLRDLALGRDGEEFGQGHQCWRGRQSSVISATCVQSSALNPIVENLPAPHEGHLGRGMLHAHRNDLTRGFPQPRFVHFGADASGDRLLADALPGEHGDALYLASLAEGYAAPFKDITFLMRPRSSWKKETHVHPFLSPDGRTGFFNSDESGVLHAYMVRGF